jgi:hypothetical protein
VEQLATCEYGNVAKSAPLTFDAKNAIKFTIYLLNILIRAVKTPPQVIYSFCFRKGLFPSSLLPQLHRRHRKSFRILLVARAAFNFRP